MHRSANHSIRVLFSILSVLFTAPAIAADIWPMFHELKRSEDSFEVTGVVCEEVARIELEEQYPAEDYDIVTGIAYEKGGRVLGELDVVVFRKKDGEAIIVAEVKCWKSLSGARKKASSQIKRFRDNLERPKGIKMYDVHNKGVQYGVHQFDENPEMLAIAQKGARSAGFEIELNYTLDELMRLRQLVLDCQERDRCSGPTTEE